MELRHKRVLVVGLARTGRAVAQRLSREGAAVTVTDARGPASFGSSLQELMAQKIGLELGVHRPETFLSHDLIVVSPGVPWDMPQLDAARNRKVAVVPEVEAASWFFRGTLVGITGTNGKTTTTTLLGKMLEASGFQTYVAGNIGVPLISAVDVYSPESVVAAELSSFQLEAIRTFRPHVAVLLNIAPNHLDRHRTFEAYVSAKAQIFRNQQPRDYAVLNADDPVVMGLASAVASRKLFFSMDQDLPEGVMLSRGRVLYRVAHLERVLFEEREMQLRGAFNTANAMAAAAAACVLGADFKAIRSAVREFTGVEHRLEYVATIRGVAFYNDSKATSVDAAAKALSTFERGVHLILGGKDKGAPYTPLRPLIETRVESIYLIGAAADKIAADLEGVSQFRAGDLESAVAMAFQRAVPGDIVLLSPACASYDQFRDFEERGQAFKQIVQHLAEKPIPEWAPPAPAEPRSRVAVEPEPASPIAESGAAPAIIIERATEPLAIGPFTDADSQDQEAPSAPKASAGLEYIYEVGSEELPPGEPELSSLDSRDEPALEDTLIEEDAPTLPHEAGRGEAAAQPDTGAARKNDSGDAAPEGERKANQESQASLFAGERKDKPFDEGA
ncbi:MAG: UDP-N-acetylmuramoyl-L-alanine--D-glutamate ligase [Terriglobia bacterium]